jgi:hypothetical protein
MRSLVPATCFLLVACVRASATTDDPTPPPPPVGTQCPTPPHEPTTPPAPGELGTAWMQIRGDSPDFPQNVASGDFDGDGCRDLALSAVDEVVLFRGPLGSGTFFLTDAAARIPVSPQPAWEVATWNPSVGFGGDVDHDGADELWVGGQLWAGALDPAGPVVLVDMADLGVLYRGLFGISGGDADQDGEIDALIPSYTGEDDGVLSRIVYGPFPGAGPLLAGEQTTELDTVDGTTFASWAGDLDADGHPEIVAGAPGPEGSGCCYVFEGESLRGQPWISLSGWPDKERVPLGDLDGDGASELLERSGADFLIVSGAELMSAAGHAPSGLLPEWSSWDDRSVARFGDMDLDGREELFTRELGAPNVLAGGSNDWTALTPLTVPPELGPDWQPRDRYGLTGEPDVNGDGLRDGVLYGGNFVAWIATGAIPE